jgi:hypothetical protein
MVSQRRAELICRFDAFVMELFSEKSGATQAGSFPRGYFNDAPVAARQQ